MYNKWLFTLHRHVWWWLYHFMWITERKIKNELKVEWKKFKREFRANTQMNKTASKQYTFRFVISRMTHEKKKAKTILPKLSICDLLLLQNSIFFSILYVLYTFKAQVKENISVFFFALREVYFFKRLRFNVCVHCNIDIWVANVWWMQYTFSMKCIM